MEGSSAHLPTVKQLRYFVALAEHRHFGRAAAACHVSQSAFSVAIRELETLLGANLVDRTNRKVTITAIGREVAARAKRCLRDLTALAEAARREDRPLEGPLHLGVIPTIAPFMLPRVLPAVRQAFRSLKLFLHEDVTQGLYEQLMEGGLDIVLLALPYDLTGVERMILFKDRFRLAARKGSALVDPEHYRPDRLRDGSVLLLREGHCLREHAVDACRIRESEKMSAFSASSLLTLIEMVDADLGITFLPEMADGSAMLQSTQVATYPLGDNNYRSIGLVWRRGSPRGEEFRMLGDFITEHYKKRATPESGPRLEAPAAS
jgi:LysR family transcriptional regulator, hydrogen peroxide-inducible genes activator